MQGRELEGVQRNAAKKKCYDRCYIGLLLEIHFDPWLPQTRAPVYGEGGVIQGFVMQIANAVE